jgi:hypothetical protein
VEKLLKSNDLALKRKIEFSSDHESILSYASDPTIVKMLIDAKASVEKPVHCYSPKTIIDMDKACSRNKLDSVKLLVAAGASIQESTIEKAICADFYTPQEEEEKIRMIDYLLDACDDASAQYLAKWVLHNCAKFTASYMAKPVQLVLTKFPSLVDTLTWDTEMSPLALAVEARKTLIVETLINAGANVNFCDKSNYNLLYILSCCNGFREGDDSSDFRDIWRLLLKSGTDPTTPVRRGWTLLMNLSEWFDPDNLASIFIGDILDAMLDRDVGTGAGTDTATAVVSQSRKRQRRS